MKKFKPPKPSNKSKIRTSDQQGQDRDNSNSSLYESSSSFEYYAPESPNKVNSIIGKVTTFSNQLNHKSEVSEKASEV